MLPLEAARLVFEGGIGGSICGIMKKGLQQLVRIPVSLFQGQEKELIQRYTRQEMGHVWSDANRFAKWLEVELAATETLAEAGQVPKEAAAAIRGRAKVDVARIHELEARVKHDVIAFTMAVGE